jgi:UDP-glucose 4-epimerase
MKVLVTGSSGQLGSYLVEAFAEDCDVVGLDIRKPAWPMPKGVRSVTGDAGDYRLAMDLCRGADLVVHAAAQVSVERSVSDPVFDARENILATVNMLEAATKAMVPHFIYVSSAAIYGTPVKVPVAEGHPAAPLSPYGVSKLAGERYAFAFQSTYGLGVTSVRPFNIYSPRQDPASPYSGVITRFVAAVGEGSPVLIQGDGRQTRDFVHASDVARMVRLCAGNQQSRGKAFNCGTGKGTTVNALAKAVSRLKGREVEIRHSEPRRGDIRHSRADISLAGKVLGYRPSVSLKEGLAGLV